MPLSKDQTLFRSALVRAGTTDLKRRVFVQFLKRCSVSS